MFKTVESAIDSVDALTAEFERASDRGAAIVAGAFLDGLLDNLLRGFLVSDQANDKRLFEGTGPLATFSAKIEMTHRLGLISERERQIIHTIKSIRNDFAHELSGVSFKDQSIAKRCKNIEMPAAMLAPKVVPLPKGGESPPLPVIQKADSNDARATFQEAVITLMHILAARTADAAEGKRTSPPAFVAAHEPAERLLARSQRLMDRYRRLLDSEALTSELKTEIEKSMAELRPYLHLQEFCVKQIKAAHEFLSKNG